MKIICTTLVLMAMALNLSGCVSLLPASGPAPQLVALNPLAPSFDFASSKSLAIDEPITASLYNSSHIIIKKVEGSGLAHYTFAKGREWSERLPLMLQRTLTTYFKTPDFPGVAGQARAFPTDYRLLMDIQKFQISSPDSVEVTINVTILDAKEQKILLSQTFDYVVPSENSMASYVKAFDKAIGQFLVDCNKLMGKALN